jgi:hypothetical protein
MLFSRIKHHATSESVGPLDDLRVFFQGSTHRWGILAIAVMIPVIIGIVLINERRAIPYRPPELTYVRMEAGPGENDAAIRAFHEAQAAELKALQDKAKKDIEANKASAKKIDDTLKSWHLK